MYEYVIRFFFCSSIETQEMGRWQVDGRNYAKVLDEYHNKPPKYVYFNKGL